MSEHHYHLTIKDYPEEYAEKYPEFVRDITDNVGHISVNFTEPHTLSLWRISDHDFNGEVNLENVIDFLLHICNTTYGYPTPEKSDLLRYCKLEEKPDCEDHLRIRQQQASQA